METLLSRLTSQALNYAIRSTLTLTTTYALRHCTRLLQSIPPSPLRSDLRTLHARLEAQISILSPALDCIDLIAARGNTTLSSAAKLSRELRCEVQTLGRRAAEAGGEEAEVRGLVEAMRGLLRRVEDAVPLINLAITTSGVNLSTSLAGSVSPSRLLQASTFLTAADSQYTNNSSFSDSKGTRQQVGPEYTLSVYMLFAGHKNPRLQLGEEAVRPITRWKEVMHKSRVKLLRVPQSEIYDLPSPNRRGGGDGKASEFAYHLLLIEDLDDDRVHTFDGVPPGPCDDVPSAGLRDIVPVHEISKIFYADTGKILGLNVEGEEEESGGGTEVNNPVLLLKRDVHARPPWEGLQEAVEGVAVGEEEEEDVQAEVDAQFERESAHNTPQQRPGGDNDAWRLPPDLDPEWIALEVYTESPSTTNISSSSSTASSSPPSSPLLPTSALSNLHLHQTSSPSPSSSPSPTPTLPIIPAIKSTLSLLELLLKLTSLQQLRQTSHLAIEDELLNFFLHDAGQPQHSAAVAGGREQRRRLREQARERVGFDPYEESPVKVRQRLGRPDGIADSLVLLPLAPGRIIGSSTPPARSPALSVAGSTGSVGVDMDRLALQEKDAVVKAKKRTRPARSPRVWEEATPIKDKDVGTGSNSPCPSKSYTGQEDKMEKKGLEV